MAARGEAVVEMTFSTLLSFVMGFLLLVGYCVIVYCVLCTVYSAYCSSRYCTSIPGYITDPKAHYVRAKNSKITKTAEFWSFETYFRVKFENCLIGVVYPPLSA